MKKILWLMLLSLAASARAAEGVLPTAVHGSSTTVVSLSTSAPTELTGGWGAWNICVQNISTSAAVSASGDVAVSSNPTTSGKGGVIVPAAPTASTPNTPTCWLIYQMALFYAQTWSTAAAQQVIVYMTR